MSMPGQPSERALARCDRQPYAGKELSGLDKLFYSYTALPESDTAARFFDEYAKQAFNVGLPKSEWPDGYHPRFHAAVAAGALAIRAEAADPGERQALQEIIDNPDPEGVKIQATRQAFITYTLVRSGVLLDIEDQLNSNEKGAGTVSLRYILANIIDDAPDYSLVSRDALKQSGKLDASTQPRFLQSRIEKIMYQHHGESFIEAGREAMAHAILRDEGKAIDPRNVAHMLPIVYGRIAFDTGAFKKLRDDPHDPIFSRHVEDFVSACTRLTVKENIHDLKEFLQDDKLFEAFNIGSMLLERSGVKTRNWSGWDLGRIAGAALADTPRLIGNAYKLVRTGSTANLKPRKPREQPPALGTSTAGASTPVGSSLRKRLRPPMSAEPGITISEFAENFAADHIPLWSEEKRTLDLGFVKAYSEQDLKNQKNFYHDFRGREGKLFVEQGRVLLKDLREGKDVPLDKAGAVFAAALLRGAAKDASADERSIANDALKDPKLREIMRIYLRRHMYAMSANRAPGWAIDLAAGVVGDRRESSVAPYNRIRKRAGPKIKLPTTKFREDMITVLENGLRLACGGKQPWRDQRDPVSVFNFLVECYAAEKSGFWSDAYKAQDLPTSAIENTYDTVASRILYRWGRCNVDHSTMPLWVQHILSHAQRYQKDHRLSKSKIKDMAMAKSLDTGELESDSIFLY